MKHKYSYNLPNWFLALFFLAIGGSCGSNCISHLDRETVSVKVTGKENVHHENHSKYLVFTENEVFENRDTLLEAKWNSSDIYNRIREGSCYRFEVYGWRIPFLSQYRNIVSVTDVNCED